MDSGDAAGLVVLPILLLIGVAIAALVIFPHWKIFSRAGYSGALSLLLFVPLVNLIVLLWFAFSDWPALRGRQGGVR